MDKASVIVGYDSAADALFDAYDALSSAELLCPIADLLPRHPGRIADIGAGTGRDAAWFAAQGHDVVAVEPAQGLRERAVNRYRHTNILWLDDALPSLPGLVCSGRSFDGILLSGVWQHLDAADRAETLCVLRKLLDGDEAVIALSFRHGPGAPSRPCFDLPLAVTLAAAKCAGLTLVRERPAASLQPANRAAGVTWTWLVFSNA